MTASDRPVWRRTLTANIPSAERGSKADLLDVPERFRAFRTELDTLGAHSWGVVEASTRLSEVLLTDDDVAAHRAPANDMWSPTNGIGTHNYWLRDEVYRSRGRRNIHTDAGPNERGLNMPLTLLLDEVSGAQHYEFTVHNYAKAHASAAARREVVGVILDVVTDLRQAGIEGVVRGDLNDDTLVGAKKAGLGHAARCDVQHIYVTKGIEVAGGRAVVKRWGGRLTDHKGAATCRILVPIGPRVPLPKF